MEKNKKTQKTNARASSKDKKINTAVVRAFIAKWLFVILASFWMFILGVFVGRSTAPFTHAENKLEQEWAELKKESKEKEYKKYNINPDGVAGKTDLGFYEELKKPKTTARLAKTGLKSKNDSAKKAPANTTARKVKLHAPGVDTSARPPAKRKRAPNGRFAIQVASMRSAAAAEKLVADLNRKGYNSYKRVVKIPGRGEYHRVRIGYFRTKKKAESLITALKKKGISPILVEVEPD